MTLNTHNTHKSGVVRLLPSALPLTSLKTLAKHCIKSSVFTISPRCSTETPKAMCQRQEKLPCGKSVARPQILYSMAATIVRLERDSYRRSCFDLCPQERNNSSPISRIQFSKQTAGIKACIQLRFLYFYVAPTKCSQIQYCSHKQGRSSYVTDLALRPLSSIFLNSLKAHIVPFVFDSSHTTPNSSSGKSYQHYVLFTYIISDIQYIYWLYTPLVSSRHHQTCCEC